MFCRALDRLPSMTAWGVTALLAAALSAGTGRAECGDYVHVHVRPTGLAELTPADPLPASQLPAPCNGPNCSFRKTPGAPAAPAPAPPSNPGPSDALLAHHTCSDPPPSRWVVVVSLPLPTGPAADMFRPPRAA